MSAAGLTHQNVFALLLPVNSRTSLVSIIGAVAFGGFGAGLVRAESLTYGALFLVLAAALYMAAAARTMGPALALLGLLLITQTAHGVEHVVQVVQYYVLHNPAAGALGWLVAANNEWLHFLWNIAVWVGIIALMLLGMRSPWAWILLVWATAHGLEHAYLLFRYLDIAAELGRLGIDGGGAVQSLPGVLGRDGWLSLQSWCGQIPGITTASRVTVHFVWNAGETILLWTAGVAGFMALRQQAEGYLGRSR